MVNFEHHVYLKITKSEKCNHGNCLYIDIEHEISKTLSFECHLKSETAILQLVFYFTTTTTVTAMKILIHTTPEQTLTTF